MSSTPTPIPPEALEELRRRLNGHPLVTRLLAATRVSPDQPTPERVNAINPTQKQDGT